MKNYILVTLFALICFSCSNNDDSQDDTNPLLGEWQLVEVLLDPGDGTGVFRPEESDKVITFDSNGTVTSNGNLCELSSTSLIGSFGTYSLEDYTISIEGCDTDTNFEIINSQLIVTYVCTEACKEKYIKVE